MLQKCLDKLITSEVYIMVQITKREERILIMEKLYSYDMENNFIFLTPLDDYSDYVNEIVNFVCANLNKIDELISSSLVNYRLSRLSYVDRAIIRMATAELLNGLAKKIVINEALEIVKLYSDEGEGKSVAFVNKVLDTIAKKI